MSATLTARKVRLQTDASVPDSIIDRLTGEAVRIPARSDWRFEIGVFVGLNGSSPSSAAQIPSPTTDAWQTLELIFQSTAGTNIVYGTANSFTLPTYATWNDDTAQHAVITQDDAESNITPGLYHIALRLTTVGGKVFNVGTGKCEVFQAYDVNTTGGDPDENPGAPVSLEVADARFERALGNPSTNGYVLSSTTLGVRSWVAPGGGGGSGDMTLDGTQTVTGPKTFEGSTLLVQVQDPDVMLPGVLPVVISSTMNGGGNFITIGSPDWTLGGAAGTQGNWLLADGIAFDDQFAKGRIGDMDGAGTTYGIIGPVGSINVTTGTFTGTWSADQWSANRLGLNSSGTTIGHVEAESRSSTWDVSVLGLNIKPDATRHDSTKNGFGVFIERDFMESNGLLTHELYGQDNEAARPFIVKLSSNSTASVISIEPDASGCVVTISNPQPSTDYLQPGLLFYFDSLPGTVTVGGLSTTTGYRVLASPAPTSTTFHLGDANLTPITAPNYSGTAGQMNRGGYGAFQSSVPTTITVSEHRGGSGSTLWVINTQESYWNEVALRNDATDSNQTYISFDGKFRAGVGAIYGGMSTSFDISPAAFTDMAWSMNLDTPGKQGWVKMGYATDASATPPASRLDVNGTVTATGFVGALTGNVTGDVTGNVSGNAGTVTVSNDAADTTSFLVFANSATGANALKTNAGLTFDASTGTLSAQSFSATGGAVTLSPTTALLTIFPTFASGSIDNCVIGGNYVNIGNFSTLTGTSSLTLGIASNTAGTIGLKNATSTGTTTLANANVSANNYTATLPAKTGTVAMTSDILTANVAIANCSGAGNQTLVNGGYTALAFGTEVVDTDGQYNSGTSTFTAVGNQVVRVSAMLSCGGLTIGQEVTVYVGVDGTSETYVLDNFHSYGTGVTDTITGSVIVSLTNGQTLKLYTYNTIPAGSPYIIGNAAYNRVTFEVIH